MPLGKFNSCTAMAQGMCGPNAAAEYLGKRKEGGNDDSALRNNLSKQQPSFWHCEGNQDLLTKEPSVVNPERRRSWKPLKTNCYSYLHPTEQFPIMFHYRFMSVCTWTPIHTHICFIYTWVYGFRPANQAIEYTFYPKAHKPESWDTTY